VSGLGTVAEARRRALDALHFARLCTRDLLEGFPEEQLVHQLAPGDVHALWILGHLAVSDEWIEGMIAPFESRLPAHYKKSFGHKSIPIPEPGYYPMLPEVREHFESSRRQLIAAVENAEPEQLLRELGDAGVGFASDPLDAVNKTAWHEGWHAGQLSRIRRAIGLPPIFPD
jgi:hypothetical protein